MNPQECVWENHYQVILQTILQEKVKIYQSTTIWFTNLFLCLISRLPGGDGRAVDAVSAYTQVKMEDAHKLLKIPKSECPEWKIHLFLLKGICTVIV